MTTFEFSADSDSIAMIKALLDKVEWQKLDYGDLQKNLVLAQRGIGFILEDLYKQHEIFESEKTASNGSAESTIEGCTHPQDCRHKETDAGFWCGACKDFIVKEIKN